MRPGGGRQKGSSFERKVAKLIVDAFKAYKVCAEDCYRTPGSGGHRYASKLDPGDLVISPRLRQYFPFAVECKAYKTVQLKALFHPQKQWKKTWMFGDWLQQTCRGAREGLTPLLIFKENGQEPLCCFPDSHVINIKPRLTFRYNSHDWLCVRLESLLEKLVQHANNGRRK